MRALPALHPDLIAAQRQIALAAGGDKVRALESEALRIGRLVAIDEIPYCDAVDTLCDAAQNNNLYTRLRRDSVEHIISEGLAGRRSLFVRRAEPAAAAASASHQHYQSQEVIVRAKGSTIIPAPRTATGGHREQKKRIVAHRASEIAPAAVDWLWPGRIAIGKTTLFGGDPGVGKSQLSIFVAATVSRGGAWPCNEGRASRRSVIILSAEDGLSDTIVPRLIAAGADLERIRIVTAVTERDGAGRRIFSLSKDLDVLEQLMNEMGDVGLIIIDPVDAYIGAGIDSHKSAAMRSVLEPTSELADRLKTAVLAITHFSKQGGKALYRFIGSIANVASARVAFAVIADIENEGRVLVLHAKNNLAPPPKGLAFRLGQHVVHEGVVASSVHFDTDHVSATADDALRAASEQTEDRSETESAMEFLRDLLAHGPMLVSDIEAAVRGAGLLEEGLQIGQSKPFRAARQRLGIVPRKQGMQDGWAWHLPPKMP